MWRSMLMPSSFFSKDKNKSLSNMHCLLCIVQWIYTNCGRSTYNPLLKLVKMRVSIQSFFKRPQQFPWAVWRSGLVLYFQGRANSWWDDWLEDGQDRRVPHFLLTNPRWSDYALDVCTLLSSICLFLVLVRRIRNLSFIPWSTLISS